MKKLIALTLVALLVVLAGAAVASAQGRRSGVSGQGVVWRSAGF